MVAFFNVPEKARERNIFSFFFQLLMSPFRAGLGARGEEYLELRVGNREFKVVAEHFEFFELHDFFLVRGVAGLESGTQRPAGFGAADADSAGRARLDRLASLPAP